jgi:RimJ/RimL family protein N-acetyltransferase
MTPLLDVTLAGKFATLSPLGLDDVPGLLGAACEDRISYGFTPVPDTDDRMRRLVREHLAEHGRGLSVPFTTRNTITGSIVGMTRFLNLRWWYGREFPDGAEIGSTFLAASAQRTAINTDAKLLMLAHAFDTWHVQRLDLKTDERNIRSRAAIERLGAHFDGILRNWQPSAVRGEEQRARNTAMYSILPSEWAGVRDALSERLRTPETS